MNVRIVLFGVSMLTVGTSSAADGFSFVQGERSNYQGRTQVVVSPAANGFVVSRAKDDDGCTAWGIRSECAKVPSKAVAYAVDFEICADRDWNGPTSGNRLWDNALVFFDRSGAEIGKRKLNLEFRKGAFAAFRFAGEMPAGTSGLSLQFGVDSKPPVSVGERVEVRGASFTPIAKGTPVPSERHPDLRAPVVTSLFDSPSPDVGQKVVYRISDASPVDWNAVVVSDRVARAAIPFDRSGDTIVLRPDADWTKGVHRLSVSVRDVVGNAAVAEKAFLIGESPKAKRVTLRDDGVTLVDGKPFYPIGIYGIKPHEFNGQSFDRAIRDLRAAGLNAGHAYQYRWDPDFLSAADKNGMKLWTDGKCALADPDLFLGRLRDDPSTIAWYIGDDTSMYATPGELHDRDEACRMLDGTRLTCHADGVRADAAKSNFEEYVRHADVFLPEIYPFDGHQDENCVAEVCRDMDRCRSDIRKVGSGGRHLGIWAILQCFHGKSWHRYPTPAEMYATSFAAVVHGATGMTWFHYAGATDDPEHRYSGMFRTPEDWAAMTNITRRIAALSPVLLARTPAQPPIPEVIAGPKTDGLGQPSVTALMKIHNDDVYLLAVNAATNSVRAKFCLPNVRTANGKVAWERRAVSLVRGEFEDDFDVLGVHVYRFQKQ